MPKETGWENPARMQHNTVLTQRVMFMKILGVVNCWEFCVGTWNVNSLRDIEVDET